MSKSKKKFSLLGSKRVKVVAKKAKLTTNKTKQQAGDTLRSISDQVVGSKDHGIERPEAPRITNDTVAEHREAVLSEARRFIYPLHSRARVVAISTSIIVGLLALIVLLAGILLYGFQSTGDFAYNISKLVPFPVARVDGDFVSFENYLFEVRHSLFYLRNHGQEGVDIDREEGKALLTSTKQRALEKIQLEALAKKLAKDASIEVTAEEVAEQVALFEVRGGVDQSEGTLESVLRKYYDWNLGDLDKVVENQLIYQKLLPVLDTEARDRVDKVVAALDKKMPFTEAVDRFSEDPISKELDGLVGDIDQDSNVWSKEIKDLVFSMKVAQVSDPVVSEQGYHIFRLDKIKNENTRTVSQILITFFDIDQYLRDQLETVASRSYIEIE